MKSNCHKHFKTIEKDSNIKLHIQAKPCTSTPYKQFKIFCQSCRQDEPCSFINLRGFKISSLGGLIYGPYFPASKRLRDYKSIRFNTKPYSRSANSYVLKRIRPTLQKSLNRQMEVLLHGSNKPIQRDHIVGYRHVCDTCSTSFFIHYYVCAYCAIEICIDCYESLKNTPLDKPHSPFFDVKQHSRSEFILFSKLSENEISYLIGSTSMELNGQLYNENYAEDDEINPQVSQKSNYLNISNKQNQCKNNNEQDTIKSKDSGTMIQQTNCDKSITAIVIHDTNNVVYKLKHNSFVKIDSTKNEDTSPLIIKKTSTDELDIFADSINTTEKNSNIDIIHSIQMINQDFSSHIDLLSIDENENDRDDDTLANYFKILKTLTTCKRKSRNPNIVTNKIKSSPKPRKIAVMKSLKLHKSSIQQNNHDKKPTPVLSRQNRYRRMLKEGLFTINKDNMDYLNMAASDITLNEFQKYWQTHRPALITNSIGKSEFEWTPRMFRKACNKDIIEATDFDGSVFNLPAKSYFKAFSSRKRRKKLCKRIGSTQVLKIKDWPQNQDLDEKLPGLYEDFMRTVPVPEYCSAKGYLNLTNRLPEEFVPPDLGPKLFISYGSDRKGKTGKTNLHCDITDAVNVMYYSNDKTRKVKPVAASVWHIFPYESISKLELYIKQYKDCKDLHPIFDHAFYLSPKDLNRLRNKFGVIPFTLYQNAGDTVFIPAGCAHQVTNYSNSIKCAFDFLSPENVESSLFITEQLRKLNKQDALQVQTTLAYAWRSLKTDLS